MLVKGLISLCIFLVWHQANAQVLESTSGSPAKIELIDPYAGIRKSLFIQAAGGHRLGTGIQPGVQLRKFISLQQYIYSDISVGFWSRNETKVSNGNGEKCNYSLKSKTISLKLGPGFFDAINIYVGAFYVLDLKLRETVPNNQNSIVFDTFQGDITNRIRNFVPLAGFSYSFRIWKAIFVTAGVEYWFIDDKIFDPLKGHWRIPDISSPLLSELAKSPAEQGVTTPGFFTIHLKL